MAKEMYPEAVFENQTNGTVFFKEGKLNDPLMGSTMAGTFESWRYSFDAGKQIFKATDSEKVYEKRIIKDMNGNPHWSGWMEICPGEANGIQAVAINDQPLLLPNTEGAIKLTITPQMIDTYSKREIYDLVASKVNDAFTENYEYVNWIDGCDTAVDVLEKTYADGGEVGKFYLVEPKPVTGTATEASYFIWAQNSSGDYAWTSVNTPNLKSFVSYSAFNEHTSDTTLHTTAAEKAAWNAKVSADDLTSATTAEDEKIEAVDKEVKEHIADIGTSTSPHISTAEREKLNSIYQNLKEIPTNGDRFVGFEGDYIKAYEQTKMSDSQVENELYTKSDSTYGNGDVLFTITNSQYNNLTSNNKVIVGGYIEFTGLTTANASKVSITVKSGEISENFSLSKKAYQKITLDNISNLPDSVTLNATADDGTTENSKVSVGSLKFVILSQDRTGVEIGDSTLPINFVGPDSSEPTYNGVAISSLNKKATWGKIEGAIDDQTDLSKKIAEAVSQKINHANLDSTVRWDVFRDGLVKSVIQQKDETLGSKEVAGKDKTYKIGDSIVSGISDAIKALEENNNVVYAISFSVDIHKDIDDTHESIYFKTDNSLVGNSDTVSNSDENTFTWKIENTSQSFDSIILCGAPQTLSNPKVTISYVQYGDVIVELKDNDGNLKSISINGKSINISASDTLSLGAKSYTYGEEKASDKVNVYGQEIDERYAGKDETKEKIDTLEKSTADKIDLINRTIGETGDKTLSETITSISNELNEVKSGLDAKADKKDTEALDLAEVGQDGSYIKTVKEENGLISAVEEAFDKEITEASTDSNAPTSKAVYTALSSESTARENKDNEIDNKITASTEKKKKIGNDIAEIQENYLKKEDYKKSELNDTESFNLVINDSSEFTTAITDGSFVKAERILFKKGTYDISTEEAKKTVIDCSNVKYVKGEAPVSGISVDEIQALPTGYDGTVFDGIYIKIGTNEKNLFEINNGNRIKSIDVSGDTLVELNSNYKVYKFNVKDDSTITFTNADNAIDYTFYVDQGETAKTVKFNNYFTNDYVETFNGIENQAAFTRTIIKVISNNEVSEDSFTLLEVVYGVDINPNKANVVKFIIAKEAKTRYNSTVIEDTVKTYKDGDIVASGNPGKAVTFTLELADGWAHGDSSDFSIVDKNGNVLDSTGKFGEKFVYTIPTGLKDDVYIDINSQPQLVTFKVDAEYSNYAKSFTEKTVQAGTSTSLSLIMDDKFFLKNVESDDAALTFSATQPMTVTPKCRDTHKSYTVTLKPVFYAKITNFTMVTTTAGSVNVDKSKIAFYGSNTFSVTADDIPTFVKNDDNFGKLYTIAPITLVAGDGYSGSVEETADGKGYTAAISFTKKGNVDMKFVIAGNYDDSGNAIKLSKSFFIAYLQNDNPITADGVENGVFNTVINSNKEFELSASFDGSEIDSPAGTWKSSNPTIISVEAEADSTKAKAVPLTKGTAIITFTNKYTNTESTLKATVIVHAKSVSGTDMTCADKTTVSPAVKFLDSNGDKVNSSLLSDSGYSYSLVNTETIASISADGKSIILNGGISENKEISYEVIPTDLSVSYSKNVLIVEPAEYNLSFTLSDATIDSASIYGKSSGIVSITINTNCKAQAGTTLTLAIILKDNALISDSIKKELTEKFGTLSNTVDISGYYKAEFVMVNGDVAITL